jgi:hypothetical protein
VRHALPAVCFLGLLAACRPPTALPPLGITVVDQDAGAAPLSRFRIPGLSGNRLGQSIRTRLQDSYLDSVVRVAEVAEESAARSAVDHGTADAALLLPGGLTRAARAVESADSVAARSTVTLYHRNPPGPALAIVRTVILTVLDGYTGREVAVRTAARNLPEWSPSVRDSFLEFYLNWLGSPKPMLLGRTPEPTRTPARRTWSAGLKVGILDLDADGSALLPPFSEQVIGELGATGSILPTRIPARDSNRYAESVAQGRYALVLKIPAGYGESLAAGRLVRPLNALLVPGPAGQCAAAAVNQSLRRLFSARCIAQLCAQRRTFVSELERRAFVNRVATQALQNWRQTTISIREEIAPRR